MPICFDFQDIQLEIKIIIYSFRSKVILHIRILSSLLYRATLHFPCL